MSEKERSTKNRIDIARGEAAIEWEDRLMAEMCRLTLELEQVHLDERNSALNKLKAEHLAETKALTAKFKEIEQMLLDQVMKVISGRILSNLNLLTTSFLDCHTQS